MMLQQHLDMRSRNGAARRWLGRLVSSLTLAVGIIALSGSEGMAQSAPTWYKCQLGEGTRGWIPTQLWFGYTPGASEVILWDGRNKPTAQSNVGVAQVRSVRGSKVRLRYRTTGTSQRRDSISLRYNATLDLDAKTVGVDVRLVGYNQNQFARGRCVIE